MAEDGGDENDKNHEDSRGEKKYVIASI